MATPNCLRRTCWRSGDGRWGEARVDAHAITSSSPAHAGDPVFRRRQRLNREAAAYWVPRLRGVRRLGLRAANSTIVIVPTSGPAMIGPKGIVHDRISPDANFRYPPRPPSAETDRQFPPRQRAYRRDAPGSRRSTAAISPSTGRPAAAISNLPRNCTTRCRCPAATCPAITTSATTRPRSVPRQSNRRPKRSGRIIVRVRRGPLAASTPPAGASSGSIR